MMKDTLGRDAPSGRTGSAPPSPSRGSDDAGFILVAVLWILIALAAVVSAYALYLSNTAQSVRVRDDALIAESLASAAVELAAGQLVNVPKARRPTHGEVVFRMDGAEVVASFQDETARIDLNSAPKELLAGLFSALGARPEAAQDYAAGILAWRAPGAAGGTGEGAETARYRDARLPYGPRGGAFVHAEELWRVAGLPPELVAAALPHLTVYSGRPQVNEADADPVVRAALAAAKPADGRGASARSGGDEPAAFTQPGDTVRVTVTIVFDNGRRRSAEAVLLLRDFGTDPFRVLTWRLDPPAPAIRPTREGPP